MIIPAAQSSNPIRYVALGDSYTAGTGATAEESWPAVVTGRLQAKGVPIELIANLGRNGWTSRDVIEGQLPVVPALMPTRVTVLIGTNDWVQGVDAATFRGNVHFMFEQLKRILPDPGSVVVLTIPDFSAMPNGPLYSGGRDISKGLAEFNTIITEESKSFGFRVIDVYPLSQNMRNDASWASEDGLHPSAKGYARWADLIEAAW